MPARILVVDDEKNIRDGLMRALSLEKYEVVLAENGEQALKILQEDIVDLAIVDLKMPRISGEELLKRMRKSYSDIPVIILTGHGTIENAVDTMRQGAYDFLTKPLNLEKLFLVINRALDRKKLEIENRELRQQLDSKYQFANIIGASPAIERVFDVVKQVAPSNANILLTGESGTGKELIANAIHRISPRRDNPLVKVHCAALSETLLESELFGHEKGSFTGAVSRKKGRFELADSGTLFLDEIGEVSPMVQVKLLRVIQERAFERVGGETTIHVDVRIVAATNKDLMEEVKKGNFREDLYYRLKVVSIHLPPLRERKTDIPLLVSSFIKEFARQNSKGDLTITPKAITYLEAYDWPGNIRELRNVVENLVVMCKGDVISEDLLPQEILKGGDSNEIVLKPGITLEEAEKILIQQTLIQTKGNKTKAAEVLGIGRKTLHRKLEEYQLKENV